MQQNMEFNYTCTTESMLKLSIQPQNVVELTPSCYSDYYAW